MKILTEGHKYVLDNFENKETEGQTIQFIEKVLEPTASIKGTLRTVNDGTTNEEVLKMLIDRCKILNDKFPSRETAIAITKMEEALLWFNYRTQNRIERGVEGKHLV